MKPLPAVSGLMRANTPSRQHWPSPCTDLCLPAGLAPCVASPTGSFLIKDKWCARSQSSVTRSSQLGPYLLKRASSSQRVSAQRSTTSTHYRYGLPSLSYSILDSEGSVPALGTLVPAIGTRRPCPTHAPSPRSEIELHCSSPRHHLSTVSFISSS